MAESDCQSVRRVVRLRWLLEGEQDGDHLLNLDLVGPTVADDRLLYLEGSVLVDGHTTHNSRQYQDSSHVTEFQRALDVRRVEHVLHHHLVGVAAIHDLEHTLVDPSELLGKRELTSETNDTLLDEHMPRPVGIDGTVARNLRAWVDAENPQDGFRLRSVRHGGFDLFIRDIEVRPYVGEIVVILECIHQLQHLLNLFTLELDIRPRDHRNLFDE